VDTAILWKQLHFVVICIIYIFIIGQSSSRNVIGYNPSLTKRA
jgi:hypothetical protein